MASVALSVIYLVTMVRALVPNWKVCKMRNRERVLVPIKSNYWLEIQDFQSGIGLKIQRSPVQVPGGSLQYLEVAFFATGPSSAPKCIYIFRIYYILD